MCSRARTDSLTCVAYCVLAPWKAACRMSWMRVRRAVVSRSRGRYTRQDMNRPNRSRRTKRRSR